MLTMEPVAAVAAAIVLPCAVIVLLPAAVVSVVRRRWRRAVRVTLAAVLCLVGTFVAATVIAHVSGLAVPV
jgi:glucan phosphoethanolaminetransferase (alkaline phosphatase superfamily)